jgi:hypothetical protein
MRSFTALALAAALSSAAFAQTQPRTYEPPATSTAPPANAGAQQAPAASTARAEQLGAIFDKLNTSHTGKMTRAEAQAHPTVAANFDAADANHDGVLTKDEFVAAFQPQ